MVVISLVTRMVLVLLEMRLGAEAMRAVMAVVMCRSYSGSPGLNGLVDPRHVHSLMVSPAWSGGTCSRTAFALRLDFAGLK